MQFDDAGFDVVTSAVGVMFCPSHEQAAAELVRVCRPGGSIGLINWTPEGLIGSMFGVLAPFMPPPAPGAKPGSLWGTEEHVSELLGDAIDELYCERRTILFEGLAPDAFVDLMRASYGPVLRVFEQLRRLGSRRRARRRAPAVRTQSQPGRARRSRGWNPSTCSRSPGAALSDETRGHQRNDEHDRQDRPDRPVGPGQIRDETVQRRAQRRSPTPRM